MRCSLKALQQVISLGAGMWCLGCEAFEHTLPEELRLEKLVPPLDPLVKTFFHRQAFILRSFSLIQAVFLHIVLL